MQTDSTQLQTTMPTLQTVEKSTEQRELEELMRTRSEDMRSIHGYPDRGFEGNSIVQIFEMFVPLTLFIVTGIVLIKFFQNRHQERMSIIERGLDPVAYKELYAMPRFKFGSNRLSVLKWALLAIFVGLGAFVGDILRKMNGGGSDTEFYFPASMLICGGIGLIIFYMIASKYDREERGKQIELTP